MRMKTGACLLITMIALGGSVAAAEPAVGHEVVCGDYVLGKVFIVGREGRVEWEYPAEHVCDLWVLSNSNLLFTTGHGVVEVTREKKEVFKYTTKSEVFTCQRLPNGQTLVGETTFGRLVVVDQSGQVVQEVPLLQPGEHGSHGFLANARQLPGGNFLAGIYCGQLAREYDGQGQVVWQVPAPGGGRSVIRLPNGNTLIGAADKTNNARVFEVNAQGKVVWEVSNDDLPGHPLKFVCGVQRLPNGNTVVCNFPHGQIDPAPHLLEISPDKKVVWTFEDHKDVKKMTCFQVLDDPGEKALR